jgi:hypothetical protein
VLVRYIPPVHIAVDSGRSGRGTTALDQGWDRSLVLGPLLSAAGVVMRFAASEQQLWAGCVQVLSIDYAVQCSKLCTQLYISRDCWSSCVLKTMRTLQLLDRDWRQQPLEWVLQQRWEESAVQAALAALFRAGWQGLTQGDSRSAPSKGIHMLAHHCWVYPLDPCYDPFSRDHAPPHIKLCLPFHVARNLAQLRIGLAHLEVEQGRKRRVSVPRADRLCRLCSGEGATSTHRRAVLARTGTSRNVEDLKHFMLECPVYDDLHAACPAFPLMYSDTLG